MTNQIIIYDLVFTQIDIFGVYLPSKSMIEIALENEKNKSMFCSLANAVTTNIGEKYIPPFDESAYRAWVLTIHDTNPSVEDLNHMMSKGMEYQCRIAGCCFRTLEQSNFIRTWFDLLMGNEGGGDAQGLQRTLSTLISVVTKKQPPTALDKHKILKEYSRIKNYEQLREYPDYLLAGKYISHFLDRCNEITLSGDLRILKSEIYQFRVMERLAKLEKETAKEDVIFICQFCKKRMTVLQGKVKKSCELLECKLKYDASIKRKTRATTLNDESIIFKKGFDGVRKRCIYCRKRRSVNNERICERCLHELNDLVE